MTSFISSVARGAALVALLTAGSSMAFAELISGQGLPTDAIPYGVVYDFESTAPGKYSALTYSGFTLSGADDLYGAELNIGSDYAGSYNSRGDRYVDNGEGEGFQQLIFTFTVPVKAFAFHWGAADVNWRLTAYDRNQNVIESYVISPTGGSNLGDYFGISVRESFGLGGPAIAFATLTNTGDGDWIMIDNITTAPIPEPASAGLVALGALGLAVRRFRRVPA